MLLVEGEAKVKMSPEIQRKEDDVLARCFIRVLSLMAMGACGKVQCFVRISLHQNRELSRIELLERCFGIYVVSCSGGSSQVGGGCFGALYFYL